MLIVMYLLACTSTKKSTTYYVTDFSVISECHIHLTNATAKKLDMSKRMIDKFYIGLKILSFKM